MIVCQSPSVSEHRLHGPEPRARVRFSWVARSAWAKKPPDRSASIAERTDDTPPSLQGCRGWRPPRSRPARSACPCPPCPTCPAARNAGSPAIRSTRAAPARHVHLRPPAAPCPGPCPPCWPGRWPGACGSPQRRTACRRRPASCWPRCRPGCSRSARAPAGGC